MLKTFKKPIIGIVGKVDADSDGDNMIYIGENYRKAIINKGGIPFLLLPPQNIEYNSYRPREVERLKEGEKKYLEELIDRCDGILFPGGYKWYEYEEYIYEYAYQKNKPILGICLGMQMMVCMDNNREPNMLEKNETELNHYQKEERYVHEVNITENTLLKNITNQSTIKVNSHHKRHIKKVNHFKVSATSPDGLIEAVEDPTKKFILGVQWHPEEMLEYDKIANQIIDKFIESSNN